MLKDALTLFSKTDLSRLKSDDVSRLAAILRDSARFDAGVAARHGRQLARRGGSYIAARPRQAGLGLGGVALLGLGAYALYRYTRPEPETMLDSSDGTTKSNAPRPSVTMNDAEAANA